MSKLNHILVVEPPKFLTTSKGEVFTKKGFLCTYCNGNGSFRGKQISHDDYKVNPCPVCKGTGKLQAKIVVGWSPDENG